MSLLGAAISHQNLFADTSYPGGVALSRGATSTCGSGYDPTYVPISSAYWFGPNNTRYLPAVDPDNEPHPRYFYRRCPIIKIN